MDHFTDGLARHLALWRILDWLLLVVVCLLVLLKRCWLDGTRRSVARSETSRGFRVLDCDGWGDVS